jgi:hypothetical protein
MKIGIIGAGQIGGTLTRRLRALGHEVHVANSRDPRTLASLVTDSPACQQAWSSWIPATTIRASVMAGLWKSSRECRKAAGSNRNWNGPLSKRLITSMRAICSNAVGLADRLVELPCPLRATMQRPRPSSCSLSMNSVSMRSMPADWTSPGGSNPEHRCTLPISMLKACGRHFRRHAANARPIGPPRPKAPATLPIRRERRLRQSRQCVGPRPPRFWPRPIDRIFLR